ncbi:hypothetical protein [Spirillospora sp. NPDC029432]|uniref:hypothetical protein n=1 Tax=Spirillospora sp. NPDC029432 TaxID=3154599 RepID=UPI0034533A2C
MTVIAPLAVALTASMAAAPARADAGPVGYLLQDAVGNTVPAQVADVAHPTVRLPESTVEGVLKTGRGRAKVGPADARSTLGPGVLRTGNGDLSFNGLDAQCSADLDGVLSGATTISQDGALGNLLPGIPAKPPANLRLPGPNKGGIENIILNKQVRKTADDLTVSAVSLVDEAGVARDYGVVRCKTDNAGRARATGRPAPAGAGGLTESVLPTVHNLLAGQLGQGQGLPQLGGATRPDGASGPRPSHRAAPEPAALEPTGLLPADLARTATGLTDGASGLAGSATGLAESAAGLADGTATHADVGTMVPSPSGLFGGMNGLPLVG